MAQGQITDRTDANDSQLQKVGKDSQLSTVSQLGSAEGASGSFGTNRGAINEQLTSNLDLKPMFAQGLGAELGLTNNNAPTDLSSLANQFTAEGKAFETIGQDLTTLGKDMGTLQTDVDNLMKSFQTALGGNPSGDGSTNTHSGSDGSGHSSSGEGDHGHHGGSHCHQNSSDSGSATGSGCGSSDTQSPGTDSPPAAPPGTDSPPATPPGTDTHPATPPGTDTPPATPPGTDTPPAAPPGTDTSGTTPRTPGTPFASNSVFNQPLGLDAQWQPNQQLANAGVYINTDGNYNEPIYTSSASDPLVTVTSDGSAGGGAGTFQVHIPAGAQAAVGGDQTFTVNDTATGTWDSFGGFQWTGANTAIARQASNEPINGSGLTQDNSNWDEGVGTLTGADLQAGTIDHMLRMELPTTMLQSIDPNNTSDLASNAWPQTAEDGFANNGDGGPAYTGTVPYGVTIGIPAGTKEPADIKANPGAHMLWQALQDHGAMVRDSGGSGNNVIFQTDQNVDQNNPYIQAMEQYGSEIMGATQILANQGPDSINGGGTPIVSPDAPIA